MVFKNILITSVLLLGILPVNAINYTPDNISASLSLKTPGNKAVHYPLIMKDVQQNNFNYQLVSNENLPVMLYKKVEGEDNNKRITLFVVATEDVYFNIHDNGNTHAVGSVN